MQLRFALSIIGGLLLSLVSSSCYSQLLLSKNKSENDTTEKSAPKLKLAGVPAGFQFLMEKQTTAVDIFYGDVYLTTTLATYSPTTVEFHSPEDIVRRLDNLLTPEQVANALTGEIDSHVGEICYNENQIDCGVITPDEVGVIFDEGKFRADIFINPNLLSAQQINFARYLSPPESDFSYISNMQLVASGGDKSADQYSLTTFNLFSLKEHRILNSLWFDESDGESKVQSDGFYWQMDQRDFQHQAGWFNNTSGFLTFMPSLNILGYRYSTSLKARVDLRYATGTEIQIYIANRSRVNIIKDGRILGSRFYSPGIQTLDTSNLPDGAYNIDIKITDKTGREEIQTKFFVKSPALAPVEQDLYYFEIGEIQEQVGSENDFPKGTGKAIASGGYSHRLMEDLGVNLGLAATEENALFEAGLFKIADLYNLEPKILLTAKGNYGASLGGYYRFGEWSTSFQMRRLFDKKESVDLLSQAAIKQYSLSLNRGIYKGQMRLGYNFSERNTTKSDISSLSYLLPIKFQKIKGSFNFSSMITNDNGDNGVLFTLNWNYSEGNYNHSANTRISEFDSDEREDNGFSVGYTGGWSDQDMFTEDVRVQWGLDANDNSTSVNFNSSLTGYLGSARIGVSAVDTDFGSQYFHSVEASTSIAGEKSVVGMGGKNVALGAVVVYVEQEEGDEKSYDVMFNNTVYTTIKAGTKVVIPVAPYGRYNITINDRGKELASFTRQTKAVTIYPGNVKYLTWQPRSVAVLITKIYRLLPGCLNEESDECWDVLTLGTAMGVNDKAITDGEGFIQTEVYQSDEFFTIRKKGEYCKVSVKGVDFSGGVAFVEDGLRCYPSEAPTANQ